MKRFFLAALLLFAAVAFTGCDSDDDELYDTLSGRVWAGDLGFYQDGRILWTAMSISGRTASAPTSSATPTRGVTSTRSTSSGTPTTTKSTSATGGPITRANCATYTSAGVG